MEGYVRFIITLVALAMVSSAAVVEAQECQDFSSWPSGHSGSGQVTPPATYSFEPGWDFYMYELISNPGDGDFAFVNVDPTAANATALFGRQTHEITVPIDTNYIYLYSTHYNTPAVEISLNGGVSWTTYAPPPFPPTPQDKPYQVHVYLGSIVAQGQSFLVRGAGFEWALIGICVDEV